jgi:hypothetical protein
VQRSQGEPLGLAEAQALRGRLDQLTKGRTEIVA